MEEGRMTNSESALRKHFANEAAMRIAMEAGTHSPWVSRLLKRFGHQVLVANPRKIRAITGSESKNDRNDAEQLGPVCRLRSKLLSSDRAPQRAAPAGSESDPCSGHAGSCPDHDHQCGARAGQKRRRTAAQLLHGVVCRAYAGCHSAALKRSIHAAAKADRHAHSSDRPDG